MELKMITVPKLDKPLNFRVYESAGVAVYTQTTEGPKRLTQETDLHPGMTILIKHPFTQGYWQAVVQPECDSAIGEAVGMKLAFDRGHQEIPESQGWCATVLWDTKAVQVLDIR